MNGYKSVMASQSQECGELNVTFTNTQASTIIAPKDVKKCIAIVSGVYTTGTPYVKLNGTQLSMIYGWKGYQSCSFYYVEIDNVKQGDEFVFPANNMAWSHHTIIWIND